MRSFSINTENYDYHKKLIINTLEMYKIQILNTLKGNLPINKQYILDITKEFKKKYNLKCVNLVYMINIMPRVSYIQVKKGTDIFKICTSYIILFGNNKINIMFDDMFTYKNYFAEINYFTFEEYNDIKNFNKNKNVNMSNIVNISNNICNPFKECSYEFDNCKIIYEYNGIDNKIKETIINNNVL